MPGPGRFFRSPEPCSLHERLRGNPAVFMDIPMIKQAVSEKMRDFKV